MNSLWLLEIYNLNMKIVLLSLIGLLKTINVN